MPRECTAGADPTLGLADRVTQLEAGHNDVLCDRLTR